MLRDIFSFQGNNDASREFTSVTANVNITTGNGRDGGAALRMMGYNSSWGVYTQKTYDAQQTWIIGFRIKTKLPTIGPWYFLKFVDGSTTHVQVALDTDGTLKAYRDTTLLGSSTNVISADTLYYLEIKVKIDDSTGIVNIKVAAPGESTTTSWLSLSSQDTRNGGNATADNIYWGTACNYGSGANYSYYCDGYVLDGQTGLNDFLGPQRCDTKFFTADGYYTDWTPSTGSTRYAVVDDNPANDDTDYATGTTGNKMTLKTFSLGYTPVAINGVKLTGVMKKTDSGTINVKRKLRKSGTDYNSSNLTAPTTSYTHVSEVLETDPATSAAFTRTDLEGVIEWGFEVV